MTKIVQFNQRAAVELAHALCQWIGSTEGVRVLSIKGPISEAQGLRPPRISSDADVIVEPDGYEKFCQHLMRRGWHRRYARKIPSTLEHHSRAFIHPDWPVDIDVHHYYPGSFVEKSVLFDTLWEYRTTEIIASREIVATNPLASSLVMLLHAARQPRSGRHIAETRHLETLVRGGLLGDEGPAHLLELARSVHAVGPIRPFLVRLGVSCENGFASKDQRRLWEFFVATNDDGAAAAWLLELFNAPVLRKPYVLWRAVYPTNSELQFTMATSDLGWLGRHRLRWVRLGRGCTHLVTALRAWWWGSRMDSTEVSIVDGSRQR